MAQFSHFFMSGNFQSTFLKISECTHHSLLMPLKFLCEIFHKEVGEYFDWSCLYFQSALQMTHECIRPELWQQRHGRVC